MVQVQINDGILEGELIQNIYGGEYYSFKGIPYAAPPLGDLRFKAPQPVKAWTGIRDATKFGPICTQYDIINSKLPTGASEDCLYLNVYSPQIKPDKPLPVMVWIHGGAFVAGSGNDDVYGPQFLIKHNVLVVTINYRLEVIGFLSLETEDIPGNAGMKDQVAALRWVNKNIKNFGGDPKNVTIFGESAGGTSVGFHLISPMSKGLFKRAIPQSGACNCHWGTQRNPRMRAEALATKMGCFSTNDKELYEFFKSQPVENLIHQTMEITYAEANSEKNLVYFSVVDEQQFGDNEIFFNGNVNEVLRNQGIHEGVEILTGYTEDEGLISLLGISDIDKFINNVNTFNEFFVPPLIVLNTKIEEQLKLGKIIKEHYYGNNPVTKDNLLTLCRFQGMDLFKFPMIEFVKQVAHKNKVYLYHFNCFCRERNIMTTMTQLNTLIGFKDAICHGDDVFYLFHCSLMPKLDTKSEAYKMVETITRMWTNFAKFGNPTPDDTIGVKWARYTVEEQNYMEVGNTLQLKQAPERNEVEFFESIFSKYCPEFILHKLENKI